jgi:hypothetical protein
MKYIIKFILLLNFFILAWFTFLQFNDPDALIWIGVYGTCSLIPLLALFNRFYKPLFWLAIFCCLGVTLFELQGAHTYYQHRHEDALMQSMNSAKPYIEEAREFLGGLIAMLLVIFSDWIGKRPLNSVSK